MKIQEYLYEIVASDYEYTQAMDALEALHLDELAGKEGCANVRYGPLVGRNFDWAYDESDEYILRVPAKEGRHASIGIATALLFASEEPETEGGTEISRFLPFYTMDGINDCGFFCSISIPPLGDGALPEETNPGKVRIPSSFLPRILLDQADSVEKALDILQETNIYPMPCEMGGMLFLADRGKTVVVDLKTDGVHILQDTKLLTNYYLSDEKTEALQSGKERMRILEENYAQGRTMEGMHQLLQRIYFSKAYDLSNTPLWYDDFDDLLQEMPKEEMDRYMQEENRLFQSRCRTPASEEEMTFHTVHAAVYDLEKKQLDVIVQENGKRYVFEL